MACRISGLDLSNSHPPRRRPAVHLALVGLFILAVAGANTAHAANARRQIEVQNHTAKTLVVCVVYHTREADRQWGWKNPGCQTHWTLRPGDHSNLLHDNEQVTANAIKISARDEARTLLWADHRDDVQPQGCSDPRRRSVKRVSSDGEEIYTCGFCKSGFIPIRSGDGQLSCETGDEIASAASCPAGT